MRSAWLRALVLGANDGLVSVSAVLVGVGAGSTDLGAIRLSGIAAIVGGALSMAVGEYISVSSQRDSEMADIETERMEQEKGPLAQARELHELTMIYVRRGLTYELAHKVAVELTRQDVVRAHARDELGIDVDDLANPGQAGIVSAICFTTGGIIPLLSAVFVSDPSARMISTLAGTTFGLLLFGFIGAFLGGARIFVGGMRVVVGGWLALAAVFLVGKLFGTAAAV